MVNDTAKPSSRLHSVKQPVTPVIDEVIREERKDLQVQGDVTLNRCKALWALPHQYVEFQADEAGRKRDATTGPAALCRGCQ